ncbi:MAG: TIM barrel protein [Candidatus Thorarchaeota archaeon]
MLGTSVKDWSELTQSAIEFDKLEISLQHAIGISGSVDDLAQILQELNPMREKIHSVHLRYDDPEVDNISRGIQDLTLITETGFHDALDVQVYVVHGGYPKNPSELRHQIERLGAAGEQYGVLVAYENLADKSNKAQGFSWGRDPCRIVEAMEDVGSSNVGLCLDVGHAISNRMTYWDTPEMARWLAHVHCHDTVPSKDYHLPISKATPRHVVEGIQSLQSKASHQPVIILEHDYLADAVMSRDCLNSYTT